MRRIGLIRFGGLAAMVGSVVFAVYGSLVGPQEFDSSLRWPLVLFLLGMMAVVAALHQLLRVSERYVDDDGALVSLIAFVGVALMALGYILADFVSLMSWESTFARLLEVLGTLLFLVSALAATGGVIVLAVFTLAVRVLPRWVGVALVAGNPLLALFIILILNSAGPAIWTWLVALPWIAVGLGVFLAAGQRTAQASRVR